jgi:Flp pilus assembly protein TadG
MSKKTPVMVSERGQSFVELVLILPILLFFTAGVIDLGRFFMAYNELRDAAQEGANYASIYVPAVGESYPSVFITNVTNRVLNSADFPVDLSTVPSGDISVTVKKAIYGSASQTLTSSVLCTGDTVEVTVTYQFPISGPFIGMFFKNGKIPVSAQVTSTILKDC